LAVSHCAAEEVEMSELASEQPAEQGNAWFYRETNLDQLLEGVEPIASIDELAVDDLTAEEAASFLRTIAE
jgi:hypothetical protein